MREINSYYNRYSAIGAVLVATGRSGAWHESSARLCAQRGNIEDTICVLGEIYADKLDSDWWPQLKSMFEELVTTNESQLTYSYLYGLVADFTEDKLYFRAHAFSRLWSALRGQTPRMPTAVRASRRRLVMAG